jgi:hypothetical protein
MSKPIVSADGGAMPAKGHKSAPSNVARCRQFIPWNMPSCFGSAKVERTPS